LTSTLPLSFFLSLAPCAFYAPKLSNKYATEAKCPPKTHAVVPAKIPIAVAYLILPAPRSDDSSSNVTRLLLPLDGGGGIIVASSLPPKENEIFLFRLLGLFAVSLSSSSSFPVVILNVVV
jgi:hypothetical protein